MKKFIAIVAMLVSVFTANAQSESYSCQDVKTVSVMPYVGVSTGTWNTRHMNTDARVGFTAGVEAQYQFTKTFALSCGVAYQQQGCKLTDRMVDLSDGFKTKGNSTIKMDYINVPVMANFYVCKGLALKIGVQAGFAVNSQLNAKLAGLNLNQTETITNKQVNKFDLSIPMGVSYEFSNVVIEGRVNDGLLGLIKGKKCFDDNNPRNTVAQFTIGYRF